MASIKEISSDLSGNSTVSFSDGSTRSLRQENLISLAETAVDTKKLRKWQAAVNKVKNGTLTKATILWFGDSETSGSGALGGSGYNANGRSYSTPTKLAAALAAAYLPATAHGQFGFGNITSWQVFDTRWVRDAAWTNSNLSSTIGTSAAAWRNNSVNTAMSFTPVGSVDRFQLYYLETTNAGTFNVNIDGGTNTLITTGTTNAVTSSTFNTTLGTHTLNITRASGTCYILGVRAWNSATPSIEIIQAGTSGAGPLDFQLTTSPWNAQNIVSTIAPDLIIYRLGGVNDWDNLTPLASFTTATNALLASMKAVADVLVITSPPTANPSEATLINQRIYCEELRRLAALNNCAFLDNHNLWESYEVSNPLGLYADTIHPNGPGYSFDNSSIVNLLTSL